MWCLGRTQELSLRGAVRERKDRFRMLDHISKEQIEVYPIAECHEPVIRTVDIGLGTDIGVLGEGLRNIRERAIHVVVLLLQEGSEYTVALRSITRTLRSTLCSQLKTF